MVSPVPSTEQFVPASAHVLELRRRLHGLQRPAARCARHRLSLCFRRPSTRLRSWVPCTPCGLSGSVDLTGLQVWLHNTHSPQLHAAQKDPCDCELLTATWPACSQPGWALRGSAEGKLSRARWHSPSMHRSAPVRCPSSSCFCILATLLPPRAPRHSHRLRPSAQN